MRIRKVFVEAGVLALAAVSLGIALGEPAPKEPPLPGVVNGTVVAGVAIGEPPPKEPIQPGFVRG